MAQITKKQKKALKLQDSIIKRDLVCSLGDALFATRLGYNRSAHYYYRPNPHFDGKVHTRRYLLANCAPSNITSEFAQPVIPAPTYYDVAAFIRDRYKLHIEIVLGLISNTDGKPVYKGYITSLDDLAKPIIIGSDCNFRKMYRRTVSKALVIISRNRRTDNK